MKNNLLYLAAIVLLITLGIAACKKGHGPTDPGKVPEPVCQLVHLTNKSHVAYNATDTSDGIYDLTQRFDGNGNLTVLQDSSHIDFPADHKLDYNENYTYQYNSANYLTSFDYQTTNITRTGANQTYASKISGHVNLSYKNEKIYQIIRSTQSLNTGATSLETDEYSWNTAGQLTGLSKTINGLTTKVDYQYSGSQLSKIVQANSAGAVSELAFTLDTHGHFTRLVNSTGSERHWQYNDAGDLLRNETWSNSTKISNATEFSWDDKKHTVNYTADINLGQHPEAFPNHIPDTYGFLLTSAVHNLTKKLSYSANGSGVLSLQQTDMFSYSYNATGMIQTAAQKSQDDTGYLFQNIGTTYEYSGCK